MKCEPEIFSIDDLERVGEYFWDGGPNPKPQTPNPKPQTPLGGYIL
jgi:hypothetical protein